MSLKLQNLREPLIYLWVDNKRATILFFVLWILAFLSILVVFLSYSIRQKLMLVKRLDNRLSLYYIADVGIKKAIVELNRESNKNYFSFTSNLGNNPKIFKDIPILNAKVNICYNYDDDLSGVKSTIYGIIDENRKLNINVIDFNIIKRLLEILLNDESVAEIISSAIVDWRDPDNTSLFPLLDAEDSYYQNLKFSYESKDAPFETLEELLLVRGVSNQIFNKIKDYITIYGEGKININTASKNLLLALGLKKEIVDKIIAFRYGEDKVLGTTDDGVFYTFDEIIPKVSQICNLSDLEIANFSEIVNNYLTVSSNYFMIRSISSFNEKDYQEIICIVDREGKILNYQVK